MHTYIRRYTNALILKILLCWFLSRLVESSRRWKSTLRRWGRIVCLTGRISSSRLVVDRRMTRLLKNVDSPRSQFESSRLMIHLSQFKTICLGDSVWLCSCLFCWLVLCCVQLFNSGDNFILDCCNYCLLVLNGDSCAIAVKEEMHFRSVW